jgi:hypothetical protein
VTFSAPPADWEIELSPMPSTRGALGTTLALLLGAAAESNPFTIGARDVIYSGSTLVKSRPTLANVISQDCRR